MSGAGFKNFINNRGGWVFFSNAESRVKIYSFSCDGILILVLFFHRKKKTFHFFLPQLWLRYLSLIHI